MKVFNSLEPTVKPSILMVVYGEGGVGKTTFAATAPKPIIADCENGSKYFGLRGIESDVALIESWDDMQEFMEVALTDKYDTVVIDPIGELMEKLVRYMVVKADSKLVQKDGNPTMAGWGWLKQTMRSFLKVMRDSGKNIIIIAHVQEKDDEGRIVKRPMVATKLSEELVNLVDVVGYMTTVNDDAGETKRVIIVDPSSDKYVAKDRTGRLGRYIEPDFTKIVDGVRGDQDYSWIIGAQKPVGKDQIASATRPDVPNSKVEMVNAKLGTSEADRAQDKRSQS
jgi:phage nucleotide-binding protein